MKNPFHVVHLKHNGKHVGYSIYLNNIGFLDQSRKCHPSFRLKRHEAYAICKLLNHERRAFKWAEKFSDPY